MSFLTIPNGQIHYEVSGSGYPLLLFAPGFLSSRIERWRTNPARPGVLQDWLDPIAALSDHFRVIAFDVRNAGESRAKLTPTDDWTAYTGDHLALLDHLGVERCHVMGACIGVSFALALAQEKPMLVSAMVLQNPIGLSSTNRAALDGEFAKWSGEVRRWPGIDPRLLPAFGQRMFGGDFIFSVSREFVRACTIPMLLMPGDDVVHPAEVSADLLLAPKVEVLAPWKGLARRELAMRRIREFLVANEPASVSASAGTLQ
jgi:pimeloyl-ACP methyl ester carboxylesterase